MNLLRTPPATVALKQVPDALRRLWRQCTEGTPDGNVTRALTVNLIAVTDPAGEPELLRTLEQARKRMPCRLFLVRIGSGGDPRTATVSAEARGFNRAIVLEQIELCAGEADYRSLASAVRPLLVDDIHTHLYWSCAFPHQTSGFDQLAQLSDHVVVDSARFERPETDLRQLDARRRRGMRITDLNWLRLRPWRRALAEAFELFPWTGRNRGAVAIRHGAGIGGQAGAQLLAHWLQDRLGAAVTLDQAGLAKIPFALDFHQDGVDLHAEVKDAHIEVQVSTDASCHLPFSVPASRGRQGDLLAAAIDLA